MVSKLVAHSGNCLFY